MKSSLVLKQTQNCRKSPSDDVQDLSSIVTSLNGKIHRFAVQLHNILTLEECQQLIQLSEKAGYEQAMVNVGGGRQVKIDEVRNNDRCIIDNAEYAEMIYQRILSKLKDHPHILDPLLNWKQFDLQHAVGLNERLRILRYDPGCYFKPHMDGCYARRDEAGRGRRGETSRMTLLLYLNEGYQGGNTRMINYRDEDEGHNIVPRTGSVLLFEHECYHEGETLKEGRKYVLRTDLMYTGKGPGHEYSKGLHQD